MPIFNKNKNSDPPKKEPDPPEPDPNAAPPPEYVTKEEFTKLSDSINAMSLQLKTFGQPSAQPAQPTAPPEDLDKKHKETISQIDSKIADLTKQLDKAVYEGKGVSDIQTKINAAQNERSELVQTHSLNRFQAMGANVIDQLSAEVTASGMPHLSIPEVKSSFDSLISQMPPEVRMNPENRKAAYKLALGENVDKVIEIKHQESLRAADLELQTQDADSTSTSRDNGGGASANKIPKPEDVLTDGALSAIRSKGWSVDRYYQSLNYAGWEDHYEKNRDYYEGEK